MQRGGRIGDVSDYSASRFRGRLASRAAQTRQAVDDQMGEGMFFAGDEYAGDEVTSGPYTGLDEPDADDEPTSGPGIDEPPVGTPGWDEGCGISYDHTLRLIGERDGVQSFECKECGAEVVVDPNAEAPF